MKKIVFIVITFISTFLYASTLKYEKDINIVVNDTNKLMWQDDIEVTEYLETYVTAKNYCEDMVLSGYIDWRVPTIYEIQNIVDIKNVRSIYKSFQYIVPHKYQTQSVFKNDSQYIWGIDFKTGITNIILKTDSHYIRCVRDI